jgi:putative membrane protein
MICLHRLLPKRHRYALPPREITVHLAKALGVQGKLGPEARAAITFINHFGYGAMAATIYSLVEARVPTRPVLKGPLFGALVWLVSYLGLLPATGILQPRDETSRFKKCVDVRCSPSLGAFGGRVR